MSERFSDMFSVLFQGPLDRDLDLIFAILVQAPKQTVNSNGEFGVSCDHPFCINIAEHKLLGPHQGEFRISSVIDRGELQNSI